MPQVADWRWWRAKLLGLAALAAGASGCASGGWLSRTGGEIPVAESPAPQAHYPTALRDRDAKPAELPPFEKSPAKIAEQTSQKPAVAAAEPPVPQKNPYQPPLATIAPLAVVPPAMRIGPLRTIPAPEAPVGTGVRVAAPTPEPEPQPTDPPPAVQLVATTSPLAEIITPEAANSLPASTAFVVPPPPAPAMTDEERLAALSQQRDVLIAMLEDEIRTRQPNAKSDAELPHLEQQLRLLYASAGRSDEAATAAESLPAAEREAYKHLMFGLATWLTPDEQRRAPLRNARVLRSLRDATGELAAASKLDLRSLVFCEKVEYFGWYTEFPRYEFQPKQQVILYVEIDNFAAQEKGPHSFETELQGSYQIFDATGNVVAQRTLPLDKEVCRNYRRDYFLAYRVFMPDEIAAGRYRLELTIEDRKAAGEFKGRKLGEGMVEFAIRN